MGLLLFVSLRTLSKVYIGLQDERKNFYAGKTKYSLQKEAKLTQQKYMT